MNRNYLLRLTAVLGLVTQLIPSALHALPPQEQAVRWAEKTLLNMPLEKKVAQLVCTDISGDYIAADHPDFGRWISLARDYGVGGFVVYGGTPHDVALLTNALQQAAAVPLLISADFEGGPGQQFRYASEFPANMAFAAAADEELMYRAARIMAEEGRAMGIHLTYTPVSDVSVSEDNPQESVRSFGGDLDLMGRLLKAYVRGYTDAGMLTTAKHFPGRGDMRALPGYPGFNQISKSAEAFEAQEQRAFQAAVDAGVAFIMTEHIAVPSVTEGSLLPASVEPRLVQGVIRDKLGFEGIITTDDLWYDNVTGRFGREEVAIRALEAGHDILLKPADPVATIAAVTEAVRSGRISEEQIDRSVMKLLTRKAMLGLHRNRLSDPAAIASRVGTAAHLAVVSEVADRSMTLLRNDGALPMRIADPSRVLHVTIQKYDYQPNVQQLAARVSQAYPGIRTCALTPRSATADYDAVRQALAGADQVILSLFVERDRFGDPAPLREADRALIDEIAAARPGAVVAMSYGNPHLVAKMESVPAFLCGFGEGGWHGNQTIYFDSFLRVLDGSLRPGGRLPVRVSDRYPIGTGLSY
ncbi:MAG: glycoside hydrolase family 3 C-terminal domain-containing protein [Rikenellaceae bacterium]|nr:glycoside hydrolase family 3 C-terminal domain-containing protein [Rikenellaceae bacterium]